MMHRKLILTTMLLLVTASSYAGILLASKDDLTFPTQDAEAIGSLTVSETSNQANRGAVLVKKGTVGDSVAATILESSTTLYSNSGAQLTVSNFVVSNIVPFDSSKQILLRIGGSITLTGAQANGTYSGSCTLRVYALNDPSTIKEISVPINQVITNAVAISEVSPLVFPTAIAGIDNTMTIIPSASNAAEFTSTGEPGYSIVTSINQDSINLTNEYGDQIRVDTFNVTSCTSYTNKGICSPIKVGATIHAPAETPAGNYSGSATLKILYL